MRSELGDAVAKAQGQDIQFPVGSVHLEFQVGVTREVTGDGKVRFWVVELGAGGTHGSESLHKVTVELEPPVDRYGRPLQVAQQSDVKP